MAAKNSTFVQLKRNPLWASPKIETKIRAPNTAVGTYFNQRDRNVGKGRLPKTANGRIREIYEEQNSPNMQIKISV
jgi:hypothetical protein